MWPNLFIIGAPRSGTTLLYRLLSSHPSVFMSPVKEPHFFTPEFAQLESYHVTDETEYLRLFSDARAEHLYRGEASVLYMMSGVAAPRICETVSEPRFIAMVRNPVNMLQSYFEHLKYNLYEDQGRFAAAWRLQTERSHGRKLPPRLACLARPCWSILQYSSVGMFGAQLKWLHRVVGSERLHVIVFDELVTNSKRVLDDLWEFLELEPFLPRVLPAANPGRVYRSEILRRIEVRLKENLGPLLEALGMRGMGLGALVRRVNSKPRSATVASRDVAPVLWDYFTEDVSRLGDLLGRDLITRWRNGLENRA